MKTSTVLTTALNIFTLFVGIGIGLLMRPSESVRAQPPALPKIEEISPVFTAGSAGIGVILSNQVEADHLVVNGIDILKLNEGLINYLSTRPLAERADFQRIIDNAKPDTFYRMKPPPTPTPTPRADEKKESPK